MTKFWFGKDKSWARWWDVLLLNVNRPNIQHFPNQHMLLWEEKPFFIFLNMFLLIKLEKPGWRSNIEDKFVGWHLSWRNLLLKFATRCQLFKNCLIFVVTQLSLDVDGWAAQGDIRRYPHYLFPCDLHFLPFSVGIALLFPISSSNLSATIHNQSVQLNPEILVLLVPFQICNFAMHIDKNCCVQLLRTFLKLHKLVSFFPLGHYAFSIH